MIRALVVDDSKLTRKMAGGLLESLGFEIVQAYNGEEALELFHYTSFELAIVDIIMPEMDGFELTRKIREEDSSLPILILTSVGHPQYKDEAFAAGANEYQIKPINKEEFIGNVRKLVPNLAELVTG